MSAPDPPTAADPAASAAAFTARLLPLLAPAEQDPAEQNMVCSPVSARIALTPLALGARAETLDQLETALGADAESLAAQAVALREALERVEPPAHAALVDAFWLQSGVHLEGRFRDRLVHELRARPGSADFTRAEGRARARDEINALVEEATDGLITDLVGPDGLSPHLLLVLVDALHVRAPWTAPLARTRGAFTTARGERVQTDLLTGTGAGWSEGELWEASSLRTVGGALSLVLVRPRTGPEELLAAWAADPTALVGLLAELRTPREAVRLSVPPLDLRWSGDLTGALADLGAGPVLRPGADLSGITADPRLHLSLVLQQAVLRVDEEGMEAAAATLVASRTAAVVPTRTLALDVPFLALVVETGTGTPLVVARIGDPTAAA